MKILAMDSSAKAASVAILEDDKLIGETFINVKLTHSQTLMSMTEDLLKNTKTSIHEIDAFAVSAGPGSFTGVRIGISCIKGMAMPENKPCIPVSTLYSMAYNFIDANAIICAVMDARCNQVYNAMFDIFNGKITRLTEDRTISIEELYEEIKKTEKKVIFVGDGAELCYNKKGNIKNNVKIAPESKRYQRASGVAFSSYELFKDGEMSNCEDINPIYLRIPQAEREFNKKSNLKEQIS